MSETPLTNQESIPGARPGEPAPFHYVIKDSRGTVHLSDYDRTLCDAPRKRLAHVVSPCWWDRRCEECFGKL